MDTLEYALVRKKILELLDIDLHHYKDKQMQRRLKSYLVRSGQTSWVNYFRFAKDNPAELKKLKDYLTIGVTAFFRDQEKFQTLQEIILPPLLKKSATLRVWSAGCSLGHEPYSLAILLAQLTSIYRSHYILATDIDTTALDHAQKGGHYTADEVKNVPENILAHYFELQEPHYFLKKAIIQKITFRPHNLLSDAFEDNFDLIVCRNVMIYFTAEVKMQLYKRFCAALRPGGILFTGSSEVISQPAEVGMESIKQAAFYRKKEG